MTRARKHEYGYIRLWQPEHPRAVKGYVLEHILIAEKALGKPLPRGVVVHHRDENRGNNSSSNLVICTHAYHKLLHTRMRALQACGNPDWRKCTHCGNYDDLANLYKQPGVQHFRHRRCQNAYKKAKQYR